jgi:hypothetical protein
LENPLNRRKPTAIHIILVGWIGQQHHVFGGEIPRAWLVASSALSPVQIGAHSGPQLRDLVDRVGAYRERSQVKVSGGADGLPACIFALRRDLLDLYEDAPIALRL